MYVVTNRVPVAPQWRDKFKERFRNREGQADKQAGFL
jgi:heme-degrading monooxygenase HmoA